MTIGTLLYTRFHGDFVGSDRFGNKYYRNAKKLQGRERRWVVFNGKREASKVPPEWHAWLHHTTEAPLSEEGAAEYTPNLTGTKGAYRPSGHDAMGGTRAAATGDYRAWAPE